jgi:hypothetical protein
MQVLKKAAGKARSLGYPIKGRIVDDTLAAPRPDGAVVVIDQRIARVGFATALPEEFSREDLALIDRPNRTVMPGIIDGQVHILFGDARSEEEQASTLQSRPRSFVLLPPSVTPPQKPICRKEPIPSRYIWPYERHRVYLAGTYACHEDTDSGVIHA